MPRNYKRLKVAPWIAGVLATTMYLAFGFLGGGRPGRSDIASAIVVGVITFLGIHWARGSHRE